MKLKKLKSLNSALIIIAMIFAIFSNTFAYSPRYEINVPSGEFGSGEKVAVSFMLQGENPQNPLKPFECDLKFDGSKLKYSRINVKGSVKRRSITQQKDSSFIKIFYNPKKDEKAQAENNGCKMFEVVFTLKNRLPCCKSEICADFKEKDSNSNLISSRCEINIKGDPAFETCKLKSLACDIGSLSPAFCPDVYEYFLNVDSGVKDVNLTAESMCGETTVKINRHRLKPPGETTDITATVSNRRLRIKSVYVIKVSREPAGEKPKKSRKASSSSRKKLSHKAKKYAGDSSNSDEDECDGDEVCDECEEISEINEQENSADSDSGEKSKTAYIAVSCAVILGICGFCVFKFIKRRKNLSQNSSNPLNKNLKK